MALKRADLSIHQGRSIMLFTIVTIFFLPLSFFTSIFGMNNKEWEASPMSIHQQFRFMCKLAFSLIHLVVPKLIPSIVPVSFAVIIVSLLLAFSVWTRALGKMLVNVAWAALVEYSPIHWIKEHIPLSSQRFAEIERSATKRFYERKIERLGKRHDEWLKVMDEKKQAKEQKDKEQERRDFLKAKKKADGSWRKGSVSGHVLNADLVPEETFQVLGKEATDVHMV